MNSVVLLGPPGAGKGTVAEALAGEGYSHISTGDILRSAIVSETETGVLAKSFMDRGELVPDEVVLDVVRERLSSASEDEQLLLDGFPRTLVQAERLDQIFKEIGGELSGVIILDCDAQVILDRLTGRRVCQCCGATYHQLFKRPAVDGICDLDGGELFQREDDREETVRNRLEVYCAQTAPLIDYYSEKGLVKKIDGSMAIQEVLAAVVQALASAKGRSL
jgi:adenylate kinase